MSFLDALIYGVRYIYADATPLSTRSKVSFSGDFTVTDDSVNGWSRIAINASGVVTPSGSATLTNKTINLTNNTVTDTSTAAGDLAKSNGTKFVRMARGAASTVLAVNSGGTDLAYAKIVDANVDAAAAIAVTKLAPGTNGYVLTTAGGAGTWAQIVDANVGASAAIAVTKLATGTNGFVLTAAGGTPTWAQVVDANVATGAAVAVAKLAASATAGQVLTTTVASTTVAWAAPTVDLSTCGLRLSLTTAVPITTADVTGATTLYFTPCTSGSIALYDGTNWYMRTTAEISIALGTLTSGANYDVFAYWTGSAVALEFSAAWTNDTTRANAITRQDGVWVKSGTTTRRYVGTFRTTSTTQTADALLNRYLWNMYNRDARQLRVTDTTDSWSYTTAAFRQTRATSTNRFEYVTGMADALVRAHAYGIGATSNAAAQVVASGVGIDSTTVNSAQIFGGNDALALNAGGQSLHAEYRGFPGLGYHAINWLEYGGANVTMFGDAGLTTYQSGLFGEIYG